MMQPLQLYQKNIKQKDCAMFVTSLCANSVTFAIGTLWLRLLFSRSFRKSLPFGITCNHA